MADEQLPPQAALTHVEQPLNLIPVIIKEAALDSPTFRANAVHFGEQIEIIEKWLDNYVKSATKLSSEVTSLETLINTFLSNATPPQQVSEAVLDHDYTVLALKRYGEGAREFFSYALRGLKKIETSMLDPIRNFIQNDVRSVKEARRILDQAQKNYDVIVAKSASQAKTKEPSSLREDAFQLHEMRKAYLKASMDFCVIAPQVRTNLDKLLVKLFSEQWKEMKSAREPPTSAFVKYATDMERVRGWSREMEQGERIFKRELHMARKQVEASAETSFRPSREIEDYSISTVPYLGSQATSTSNVHTPNQPPMPERVEKQGWLFQRTLQGKPARTVWIRRWYFVKSGIFGWLSHGSRSGAVEESEKIGVLLCSIRPAVQEERRFCFEVKTKDTTITLQAETQTELVEWITAFDGSKRKALEDPGSTDNTISHAVDAAFAISPPVAPEFAARTTDGHVAHLSDDVHAPERASTLAVDSTLATRSSFDVSSKRGDGESRSREHAARIIEKLDLHRRSTASPQLSSGPLPSPAGGIASLISASHNILPVAPASTQTPAPPDSRVTLGSELATSTLAPSTLANPPAPTNLSKTAVIVSGERGIGAGRSDGGMPSGIMANLWGSTNWGHVDRLDRGELKPLAAPIASTSPSPMSTAADDSVLPEPSVSLLGGDLAQPHRKTQSVSDDIGRLTQNLKAHKVEDYPNYYPLPLKAQDAQFRILFPHVPKGERVVLVFRAVWNPNDQQEFPGRVYVTPREVYFFSNHLGLVLVTGATLASIDDITAAPGKDCDYIYVHFKDGARPDGSRRLTIKTFLEPLRLLQRRLHFLVRNADSESPAHIEDILKTLIKLETDDGSDGQDMMDSWEDVSINTPVDGPSTRQNDLKASLRIDGNLFDEPTRGADRNITKLKLPPGPVNYTPIGMTEKAVEKVFDISAKALFHVLFGDKSAVSQTLYRDRSAQKVIQGPWVQAEQAPLRREFAYELEGPAKVCIDYQIIEVLNDHLCYVVTDKKVPWHLPYSNKFNMVSKIVVTHVAKSQSKLAIFNKTEWKESVFAKTLVDKQAMHDLELSALDLVDVVASQVSKLGSSGSRTNKVLQIFGHIGQQTQAAQVAPLDIPVATKQPHFVLQRHTLPSMIFNLVRGAFAAALFEVLNAIITAVKSTLDLFTAHTILIALLALSGLFNAFYTQRDTYTWWQERNAGKFLSRLGVRPDPVMGRAVYLSDLSPLTNSSVSMIDWNSNQCQSAFQELVSAIPSPSVAPQSSRSTSLRVQRSRQRFGTYRHDLLVALRLVNRVESELVQAEYEDWLVGENARCQRIGHVLESAGSKEGTHAFDDGTRNIDEVRMWWEGYCGSCSEELGSLGLGVGGLKR